MRFFTEATRIVPHNYLAYFNRAGAYASIPDYYLALNDINKCVELNPDFGDGHLRKGLIEMISKDYDSAIKTFRKRL